MKLSKKILAAFSVAALLACAGTFVACSDEQDDDTEDAIQKTGKLGNDFAVAYTNTTGSTYRAYKTTTNNYTGGWCQLSMNKSSAGSGAMGIIWDLESNSAREVREPRRFFIVGFNYDQTAPGKIAYYCSMYKNITDIQANNFGATAVNQKETEAATQIGDASEKEYIKLVSANSFTPSFNADNNTVVTIHIKEGTFDADGTWPNSTTTYKAGDYNGTYVVDLYQGAVDKNSVSSATKIGSTVIIPAEDVGYVTTSDNKTTVTASRNRDKPLGVYMNCYKDKTLTGSWKYVDTYAADEVVEE